MCCGEGEGIKLWSKTHTFPVQHLWHFSTKSLSRLVSKFNFRLEWQEFPYIDTPYEDFLSDLTKFASDMAFTTSEEKLAVSPPFFGSMMSLIFRKIDK